MVNFIIFIVIILITIILAIDIIPMFSEWLSRIHIGRYNSKQHWQDKILNKSKKWLKNTPKIKVTDNTRLVFIDMLKKNYTKDAIQHWQEAALVLGISEYKKYNNDKELSECIKKYINSKFSKSGNWIKKPENIDGAILAYSLMNLEIDNLQKYKPALDYTYSMIKEHIGEDGTIQYRKHMKGYRYVDTIGFVCPFLVKYGVMFDDDECIELAVKQIKEYRKHGMLVNRQLPYHAYDINNKFPLGLCGWGRGLGWYAIGLIDSWNELPNDNMYKHDLTQYVKEFVNEIIKLQNNNGAWNWTVTRKETRLDSSTTATLLWFLVNAKEIDEIKQICEEAANKALEYLISVTRRDGAIDFSQGDTKDIGVYSILFNILPFTQGFALRSIVKVSKNK